MALRDVILSTLAGLGGYSKSETPSLRETGLDVRPTLIGSSRVEK